MVAPWFVSPARDRLTCWPRSAESTCPRRPARTEVPSGPQWRTSPPTSSHSGRRGRGPTCFTANARPGSTCSTRCSTRALRSGPKRMALCMREASGRENTMSSTNSMGNSMGNLEIARSAALKPIEDIANEMGLGSHLLEPYGRDVMKVSLDAIEELLDRPRAKYVVVTAIPPTPLGEGKTTTTVGLGQGMRHIGKNAVISIRQASMGPALGIKGGAAGGGYSQVVPMEKLNLHLTGDMHAVTAAHNLLSARLDDHLYRGNALGIDLNSITWRRVLDVNDRSLRNIVTGLGGRADGVPRETGL